MDRMRRQRNDMVARQLAGRGVKDARVLAAMGEVPREFFVPEELREEAYADAPLAIGYKQTISQPYIVAVMIEALQLAGGETVLEIGAGSGYAAAVLAKIAAEVITIERLGPLADQARRNLSRAGFTNVTVLHADGSLGWAAKSPYDAILVSAGAPAAPRSLLEQLKEGGRIVIPVGDEPGTQTLERLTKLRDGSVKTERIADVRFVPLIGAQGWQGLEGRWRT